MAIDITHHTSSGDETDATSYVTAAFTPVANALLIACYEASRDSAPPTLPSVSGHGTWILLATNTYDTSDAPRGTLWIFGLSTGGSPSSGAVTFSHAGATHLQAGWSLYSITGSDVLNVGVAGCIIQTANTAGTGTSGSITLSAASASSNRPFSAFVHVQPGSESTTPRANWTEIGDVVVANVRNLETQWRSDTFETTASGSWSTSQEYGGIAFEVKAQLSILTDTLRLADAIRAVLRYYRFPTDRAILSDKWFADIARAPLPPTIVSDTTILTDAITYVLKQYRSASDNTLLRDLLVATIQRNRNIIDTFQFRDSILSTIVAYDTVLANRAKPISRPRWLFDANIGGTKRFSSEDLEKP